MKRDLLNRIRTLFLVLAGVSFAACSESEVEEPTLGVNTTSVSANKRGLTYEGGDVTFEVTSNVYWVIHIDEEADWLTVSPRAAYGSHQVHVSAAVNTGEARTATLYFDSLDGVTTQIEVRQGSADELIYYLRTGMGADPVGAPVAVSDFTEWGTDGVGTASALFSGVHAEVVSDYASSGYEAATGGNAVVLADAAGVEDGLTPSFSVSGISLLGDRYFRVKVGVAPISGQLEESQLRLLVGNGGDEFIEVPCEWLESEAESAWKELLACFYVPEETESLDLRIENTGGACCLDDFRFYEGNVGEGHELVFQVGADDGLPEGHVYFEDDFSWVTDVYGGTDYVGTWPTPLTAEQYWNGVTAAAFGDEAYNTLINSGWVTDDNKLKERVYLRIGYIKMGRGSNAAGCGGGLVTPTLEIKHNCTANVKVSFDCCIYVSSGGSWDPSTMQVRVIGPGTINDDVSTVKLFEMQTVTPMQWETKECIVYGATDQTQIVFESVEEVKANRWFFDNVHLVKAGADEQPPVELTPLDTPEVTYDQEGSTASSVRFSWPAVESAVRYEYTYTCLNCGEVVESRSGETEETNVVFDGLIAGTSCSLTVRALPAEEDTTYEASEWCEPVEGTVKSSVTGVDSHPVGYALLEDDLSWVTVGVYGEESFVDTYPGNPAGIRFDKVSAAGKTLLEEKGWEMTSSNSAAYLYAGSIKLGTSSAVGSVFTPRVSAIDPGTKVNAEVIVGGTAFLGTNDYYDDDAAAITIEGDGTFEDGSKSVEFRMGSWNDWVRHRFVVRDITAATRFRLESRTADRGRLFFNYFGVVKLDDAYSSASELPQLETPGNVTLSEASAYGFDLSWTEVPNATDYTYYVVRPDGRIAATGKSWEPHVHIGGLDGKSVAGHPYFNVRIVANHMNYDSGKQEIPQTYRSSESSQALQAQLVESTATVYFQDDFSWIDPTSGSALLATNTDWINTYCTTDTMIRFDKLEEEGTSLHGWSYDSSKKSVYTRPGYIHLNSSSAQGLLISPALTAISGTDDVEVSFDATYFYQYFSKTADTNKTLTIALRGAGTIEGATDGVLTVTLSRGNAWEDFTFRILGADATTQVLFGPAVASKNRVQFDNFRVVSLTK